MLGTGVAQRARTTDAANNEILGSTPGFVTCVTRVTAPLGVCMAGLLFCTDRRSGPYTKKCLIPVTMETWFY